MTLKELGMEYLQQEKDLRIRLKQLRASAGMSPDAVMKRRMYYLACEATDCRKLGRYLVSYYGEEYHE